MAECQFAWLTEIPGQALPVYMGGAYQHLFEQHDGAERRVVACTLAGATVYLPLLVRDLGGGVKEAYSAYGYGGFWGEAALAPSDVAALERFLADASILCVFLRHSPFLANQRLLPGELAELNRRTYAAALAPHESFDGYLAGIAQKTRWAVNYARRARLEVRFAPLSECSDARIAAFYRLYAGLMQKKGTAGYYLFSEAFFLAHARALPADCELAEIVDPDSGGLLAGAFFLLDGSGWAHYHLSAADPAAMKLQGMELLMASAIFRYGMAGYRALHLGGGHALDESDGLSRFKSKFAAERLDFCCSRLVCDAARYQAERARLPLAQPNFFLIADARGG